MYIPYITPVYFRCDLFIIHLVNLNYTTKFNIYLLKEINSVILWKFTSRIYIAFVHTIFQLCKYVRNT